MTRSSGVTHGRSDDISLSRLSYKKLTVLFLFLALLRSTLSCPLACSLWWSSLLCCDLPCREIHMAKKQERSWDINSLGTEALRPTTCEELNPDINLNSELGSRAFPSCTLRWLAAPAGILSAACGRPWNRGSFEAMTGWPTETIGGNNSVVLSH